MSLRVVARWVASKRAMRFSATSSSSSRYFFFSLLLLLLATFRFDRGADECTHHYLGRTEMGRRNVFLLLLDGPFARTVALRGGASTIFASSSFPVVCGVLLLSSASLM